MLLVLVTMLAAGCLSFVLMVIGMAVFKALDARQLRIQRLHRVRCQLPAMMELLAMLLTAGLPLMAAMQQLLSQGRQNALQQELRLVVAAVRTGEPWVNAMQNFRQRNPVAEVSMFVTMLIQSSQHGGALSGLLGEQAASFRQTLAEEVEQQAQELPVRLLLPLIVFVFPATMLPFIGIIAAKVMWQT
ncbi:MAG: type II secretion system F family protein [Gammaproteobacteria bacterium]|nr:type II secretion system F family protein [Gammaproteobacteria bacterium]MCL5255710.1 type II secretion system F family protein [Gammaproteobacteria bacterium]